MSIGSLSRVLSCVIASATPLLVLAPAAVAQPGSSYLCAGPYPARDGSANLDSCIYAEDGTVRAFGELEIKDGTIDKTNCVMSVRVIDKDAYKTGENEDVANSGDFPCFNGRYPSPPLTMDIAKARPGHVYVTVTTVTKRGQDHFTPMYSPELVL
ncbi:hypothetical protein OG203_13180 [Nocardia sp. NBC_01499]|uniref:hypothetical protein n=1 Tax=Nocardia sp. NBC_01499 TaxID=2903597 RepID=UPI00386BB39F